VSMRTLFVTIFVVALSAPLVLANAQTTDEAARDLALSVVRSQLHLRADQFLGIHRDQELEQSLAIATVGWRAGSVLIYSVNQEGVEIKENAVVRHVATDADFLYIIAISSANGNTFRIHGFADSVTEFAKLITTVKERVTSPAQAESLAEFYRKVNPENHEDLTPILRLIELKQAGERRCQSGAKSFDIGERAFGDWWEHTEPLYAALSYQQRVLPHDNGYLVEWIVLSSPSGDNCGGAPLRAQLDVGPDGRVGKVTYFPIRN